VEVEKEVFKVMSQFVNEGGKKKEPNVELFEWFGDSCYNVLPFKIFFF
jgi:hypothetical protein